MTSATKKSTLVLVIANLVTIYLALSQGWSLMALLWVYWFQSVTIGYFQQKKIRSVKHITSGGLKMNRVVVPPTQKSARMVANFFVFHYGFFHFVYVIFLFTFGAIGTSFDGTQEVSVPVVSVLVAALAFFLNHWFSFHQSVQERERSLFNLATMMFKPYLRIFPMHLSIVFAFPLMNSDVGLVVFLGLKSVMDVLMHILEHRQKPNKHVT